MKTSKYLKTIAFCALMLAAAMPGKAQVFPNTYINIDWQVGVPLGAGFADKASGSKPLPPPAAPSTPAKPNWS